MSTPVFPDAPPLLGPRYPRTERQAEILDLAGRLAAIAAENAPAHDRDGSFPHDTLAAVRETPFLALTVPENVGGGGADPLDVMLALETLAQGDASFALVATMHLGHVAGVGVNDAWPDELKREFLTSVVDEGALYNTIASEAGLGSPSRGGAYATTATRDGDTYRIDGRKAWSTGAPALTWAGVAASVEAEDGSGEMERGWFLVPMNTPGITMEPTWDNMAMGASGSDDLVFENVVIPVANRLPAGGKPEGGPWSTLTSALYLGIAIAARNWTIDFAKNRRPTALGGKSIAELEGVQAKLAQIEMLLMEARSVLYGTVEEWQARPELRDELKAQFAAAKVIVTNNAIEVTDLAMRVVGSVGMQRQHPLERYFRDVRAGLGNPPIDDVAIGVISRATLAL